ncbi:T9SS type A sorting domain-containing protein [Pseudotenacibaculum sp. MALMAid0570]|uniref:T9SS type A sorting domain-containing protein n=1 Tax=Pseudotenacibaculum sp. MALMAid0570 TaxID=3143938 RepID=UPI0032DED3F1
MKRISFLLMFLISIVSYTQTDSGDLEVYLNNIISNMPGDSGNDYTIPSNANLTTWENCITSLLSGDLTTARTHADAVNYEIVLYTDTAFSPSINNYYVLKEKSSPTNYWGTYVFLQAAASNEMVIQAPHSDHDFNTGKQAIYSFVRLQNFALFLNGTHRCNHNQASTCSGTTSVCSGSSEAFKVSDLAHNTNSVFQKTTEVIYNTYSTSVFVQLHGFTKLASDPYVILSNGTDQTPSGTDYALELKNALSNEDATLTFQIAHIDNWTRLVGFTNTQGRYINQSANPCNLSATSSTGRFVHVEQEKSKLRQDATGWEKMHQALNTVFTGTVSVDDYVKIQFKTENPFQNSIEFSADGVKSFSLYSLVGKEIYSQMNTANISGFFINTSQLPHGIYLLKVTTDKGIANKKLIRE